MSEGHVFFPGEDEPRLPGPEGADLAETLFGFLTVLVFVATGWLLHAYAWPAIEPTARRWADLPPAAAPACEPRIIEKLIEAYSVNLHLSNGGTVEPFRMPLRGPGRYTVTAEIFLHDENSCVCTVTEAR